MGAWIFKGTDTYFRHVDYVRENEVFFFWATQYQDQIQPGDEAFLWIRKKMSPLGDMGIYGIARVIRVHPEGRPEDAPSDTAFWLPGMRAEKQDRRKPHVELRRETLLNTTDTFLPSAVLARESGLEHAAFMKLHPKTVYPLSERERGALERLVRTPHR